MCVSMCVGVACVRVSICVLVSHMCVCRYMSHVCVCRGVYVWQHVCVSACVCVSMCVCQHVYVCVSLRVVCQHVCVSIIVPMQTLVNAGEYLSHFFFFFFFFHREGIVPYIKTLGNAVPEASYLDRAMSKRSHTSTSTRVEKKHDLDSVGLDDFFMEPSDM